jgi:transposase
MSKRRYRAVDVKATEGGALRAATEGKRLVFGADIAKTICVGCLRDREAAVDAPAIVTVKWQQPQETRAVIEWLGALGGASLEVAMEPTGRYGDALRAQLAAAGIAVFKVSPKRCHDSAEVFDGVPSMHDGKAAAVITKLHLDGASERWQQKAQWERELSIAVALMRNWEEQYRRVSNRLESLLSAHWPELLEQLELGSVTMLTMLERYGDPRAVACDASSAAALMKRMGRSGLCAEKIAAVIASAKATVGEPMIAAECAGMETLAKEANRCRVAAEVAQKEVARIGAQNAVIVQLGKVIGPVTAAVVVVAQGDPTRFHCAGAYRKALGLNLKERSSGRHKGQLRITKRGSGVARRYLYFATLRLLQSDEISAAWYARKVERDGGRHKKRAVVALMRKLVVALWHVARGADFNSKHLFDVRKLDLHSRQQNVSTAPIGAEV